MFVFGQIAVSVQILIDGLCLRVFVRRRLPRAPLDYLHAFGTAPVICQLNECVCAHLTCITHLLYAIVLTKSSITLYTAVNKA